MRMQSFRMKITVPGDKTMFMSVRWCTSLIHGLHGAIVLESINSLVDQNLRISKVAALRLDQGLLACQPSSSPLILDWNLRSTGPGQLILYWKWIIAFKRASFLPNRFTSCWNSAHWATTKGRPFSIINIPVVCIMISAALTDRLPSCSLFRFQHQEHI